MREIDPIREPSEVLLSSALHRLASAGKRNAPPELGANLLENFRHHHRRRRKVRLAMVAAVAACVLGLAIFAGMLRPVHTADKKTPVFAPERAPVLAPAVSASSTQAPEPKLDQTEQRRIAADETQAANDEGFVPLPSYDPAVASSDLQMVRVEVTGSELRMLGARVAGDFSDRPVIADFITDRDGTPYAVRLVQ
ncbi:MAG TPA: hypothetical protein VLN58_12445 [Verrucomicrobiae bacterium]|nr:hypothetical protein [Verrucomicrobiae bacterium]